MQPNARTLKKMVCCVGLH